MKPILPALVVALALGSFGAQAETLDSDAECKSISEADMSTCRCPGLYFASKFGPDEGVVALHLVGRSYVSEPKVTLAGLYERFGAAKIDEVARKILETQGEVAFYCPFSTHIAD